MRARRATKFGSLPLMVRMWDHEKFQMKVINSCSKSIAVSELE